jgi:hypothetical protein
MISAGQASARAHEFWRKHPELRGMGSYVAMFLKNIEDRCNEAQEKMIAMEERLAKAESDLLKLPPVVVVEEVREKSKRGRPRGS